MQSRKIVYDKCQEHSLLRYKLTIMMNILRIATKLAVHCSASLAITPPFGAEPL